MTFEPTAEDMAAARAQGDLITALLATAGLSRKRPPEEAPATEPAVNRPPFGLHHRPGAWPSGTRPPGPNTCSPDCGCAITPPEEP